MTTIYFNKDKTDNSVTEWSELPGGNFEFQTDEELIMYEDKLFLKSELPAGYEEYKAEQDKIKRIDEINNQLKMFDEKRIRAVCEPSVKDENSGQTWLEYYNSQVQELRTELNQLNS